MTSSIVLVPDAEPDAAPRGEYRKKWTLDRRYLPVLGPVLVLVLIFALGGARYDNFLSGRVISNLLVNNASLVVLAVGMTFVILTGGIDLSVGSVVALSGVLAAWLFQNGWPAFLVIPLAILVGTVIGTGTGYLVQKFEIQPFIATLGAMFFARGASFVISEASIPISDPTIKWIASTRIRFSEEWYLSVSGVIALVVVAVGFVALHYTRLGRTVYAIGGSEQSALLMGLPVARTKTLVYVISGTCAGLAGFLFSADKSSGWSLNAVGMELDVIAAVVIGGTLLTGGSGFVLGSVLGVLVLGLIQTIIQFEGTLSSWWTRIIIGILLLVFVVLQRLLVLRRRT